MLPFMKSNKKSYRRKPIVFKGLSKEEIVEENEIIDGYNLSVQNLPALSPMNPRSVVEEGSNLVDPRGFLVSDGKIAIQDGNLFYYDDEGIGVLNKSPNFKSMIQYKNKILVFPDKMEYDIIENEINQITGSIYLERGSISNLDGLVVLDDSVVRTRGFIKIEGGNSYVINNTALEDMYVYEYDKDQKFIQAYDSHSSVSNGVPIDLRGDTNFIKIVIQTDNVNTELSFEDPISGEDDRIYPSEGILPNIDSVVEHYNRIFGIQHKSIYASAWADHGNWSYFQALESDSWAFDSNTESVFTAICNFKEHIIVFKENIMYELFGTIPSQFQLKEVSNIGCVSQNGVCEHEGILFYINKNGVYSYAGGRARKISKKIQLENIKDGCIVGKDNRIFISITQDNVTYKNYVFDLESGAWLPQDDQKILKFQNYNGVVYALTENDLLIYDDDDTVEKISWGFTTKEFDNGTYTKSITNKIKLKMKLEYNTEVKVFVKYNENNWILSESYKHKTSNKYKEKIITISPNRYSRFQIKVEVEGEAIIWGEREVFEGSEIDG